MMNIVGLLVVGLTCLVGGATRSERPEPSEHRLPEAQYRIDAQKSRLIVETQTTGLSAMFVHDHALEVGDCWGTATFKPNAPESASLELTARADSLRLLNEKTMGQRQSIEVALRDEVLETSKYPEIAFRSRSVKTERRGDGTYDVRLTGDLALHGVHRRVVIPARVSVQQDTLRAIGVFEIHQTDFKITPFSFATGSVVIKDALTISFEIVATRTSPRAIAR